MNFILLREGYPLIVIKNDSKEEYFVVLEQSSPDLGGFTRNFTNYIINQMEETFNEISKIFPELNLPIYRDDL
jgi:hypothetical protein